VAFLEGAKKIECKKRGGEAVDEIQNGAAGGVKRSDY